MNSKKRTFLSFILLSSLVIVTGIYLALNNRHESPLLQYHIDLPELRMDNTDSDIGKWILPAIMTTESLDKDFIEENVFLSRFQLSVSESVISISFSIFYYIEDRLVLKNYQIRDNGLITLTTQTTNKRGYEKLLSISHFNEILKKVDKDAIKDLSGMENKILFININAISRVENVKIEKETIIVLNNQFVEFGNISLDGNYAVCFISFAGTGGGSNLPFLIQID